MSTFEDTKQLRIEIETSRGKVFALRDILDRVAIWREPDEKAEEIESIIFDLDEVPDLIRALHALQQQAAPAAAE
jgi:hypothetical protein